MTTKLLQPTCTTAITLGAEVWARLERAGGVSLDSRNRDELTRAINHHNDLTALHEAAVRISEVRPVLKDIARALDAASQAMSEFALTGDGNGKNRSAAFRLLARAALEQQPRVYLGELARSELHDELRRWAYYAHAALDRLKVSDLGAGTKPSVNGLLLAGAVVFQRAGGKGRYSKAALSFSDEVCGIVGRRFGTRDALLKAIQQAWEKAA